MFVDIFMQDIRFYYLLLYTTIYIYVYICIRVMSFNFPFQQTAQCYDMG